MSDKFEFGIDVMCEGIKSGCTVRAESHKQAWDLAKENYMRNFKTSFEPVLTKCTRYCDLAIMSRAERAVRRKTAAIFKSGEYLRENYRELDNASFGLNRVGG
tara:strand:- start:1836 stop:2144 length:309 start_codon:yes stop_codon:yes gene_type:complete